MLGFLASLFIVTIAEMGDKTQLVALSFAAKYKPAKVVAGVFIGTLVSFLIAVIIGLKLSDLMPIGHLKILIGLSFIVFGLWTLKGDKYEEGKEKAPRFNPILTIAIAFFLAELGDKTQLATISLAAEYRSFWGVWLGSSLGMVVADGAAIAIGVTAGKKLPQNLIKYISAGIFIIFGAIIILESIR